MSIRIRKGNKYLKATLVECARGHTKKTKLSLLPLSKNRCTQRWREGFDIVIYRILKEKVLYHDLGTDCYSVINQEKLIKRNLHVLEKLGMDVIIQPK